MSIKEHPPLHVPVLLKQVMAVLQPKIGESYLDLTAGYGGHAKSIISKTNNYIGSTLVDRDNFAIQTLEKFSLKGTRLLHTDFLSAGLQLVGEGTQFDMILLDLGVSSPQLDNQVRGFSFKNDGPLDMRMDNQQSLTAEVVVNTVSDSELTRIIHEYGEEPLGVAKRYAKAIIENRPIHTTGQLAEIIKSVYVGKWKKIHPATRTFQAIRIQVNDELRQVSELMPLLPKLLKSNGRVGVISFHSLEDRIVKRYFAEQAGSGYEAQLKLINKHPIDGATYDVHNPRARSAKLRAAVKK